ncbi:MAG TPA: hypothetical protein DHU96_11730 [Actinobacteria bacterium]|nr:hypothetical protein [Actinomycetota bacterium]
MSATFQPGAIMKPHPITAAIAASLALAISGCTLHIGSGSSGAQPSSVVTVTGSQAPDQGSGPGGGGGNTGTASAARPPAGMGADAVDSGSRAG